MFRPKIFEIGDACTGCGACANICPQGCISMMYVRTKNQISLAKDMLKHEPEMEQIIREVVRQ